MRPVKQNFQISCGYLGSEIQLQAHRSQIYLSSIAADALQPVKKKVDNAINNQ